MPVRAVYMYLLFLRRTTEPVRSTWPLVSGNTLLVHLDAVSLACVVGHIVPSLRVDGAGVQEVLVEVVHKLR